MAKFQLRAGEMIIGSGQMALHEKQFLNTRAFAGDIYITNQRACFQVRMIGTQDMDLPLSEIKGYSVRKNAFFTVVTIHSRAGENYVFTGFPVKKLQGWLRQAGIQELQSRSTAQVGKGRFSVLTILRNAICIVLALCVLMALPTGWLYDLWAGEGMGQGQRPVEGVQPLRQQEDVFSFFSAQTPATVASGELVACPLARLRDVDQAGTHQRSRGKSSVYISEYITTDYPIPFWQRALQTVIGGGSYNRYYLMELEDSSYLCVYFDDYLMLTGTDSYPTGYVRYTTTEERRMLAEMAEDYDVDPVYVLDMYQHGKVSWMLDIALRFVVLFVAAFIVVALQGLWKKRKAAQEKPL